MPYASTGRLLFPWLPGVLRRLSLLTAGGLVALVFLSPLVDNGNEPVGGLWKLLHLFAHDATLRRSALASAVGLTVSAFVFFRSPPRSPLESYPSPRSRPPSDVVGA